MARLPRYVIPGQPQHMRKWCLTPFFPHFSLGGSPGILRGYLAPVIGSVAGKFMEPVGEG